MKNDIMLQEGNEKMELLQKKNIILGCKPKDKETVIKDVGNLLYQSGYVEESYIDGMLEREESFSTYIGNGIAIPHGVEEAKKRIKHSGISIMIFPEGTSWDGNVVYVVIGIAGMGDEHLDLLSNIATKLSEEEAVQRLIASDVDTIYEIFTGKE
ncbi:MAG: PTS sugar transporter subunit IIA [Clostridiales bacterium]|nr:PTS sugar transporter subunit IIA [Clostridiales bacterium]